MTLFLRMNEDVDAIKHLDDNQKEKVKELLSIVKKKSGKKDPLAIISKF